MRRIILLILAVTLALPVMAWGPGVTPAAADSGKDWTAEYFTNRDLVGAAAFVRLDSAISFDWAGASPVPGIIPPDNFSVRWSGPQDFAGGTYIFSATVDDGIRIFVNDQLVVNAWYDQIQTTHTGQITLNPGTYWVRVEYYDAGDQASVFVSWRPSTAQTASGGWAAEYYNNTSLTPPQAGGRLERSIDYNWGGGSPIPGVINPNNFSARWWGFPSLEGGVYEFVAGADDGVRVWVDSQLVIDAWTPSPYQEYRGTVELAPGNHTVRVEYFETGDQARISVYWIRTGAGSVTSGGGQQGASATIAAVVLNVRTGPGVSNPVLTQVREGEAYALIGRNEDASWLQISGPGFTGWISSAYANLNVAAASLPVAEAGSSGAATGVLLAQSNASLRVRRGPGTNQARIAALNVGDSATVVGRTADSSWLQIRTDNGIEGWVSNSFITLVGDIPLTSIPITG
jgi:uncharacterized protein YraI